MRTQNFIDRNRRAVARLRIGFIAGSFVPGIRFDKALFPTRFQRFARLRLCVFMRS
jgi:hypothetical protein